jgi:ABC-type phosphate/phosphonate transport system permease subunit
MWPDEPEDYKTPLGLTIAIVVIIVIVSCLIALPLAIIFSGL